MVFIWVRLDFLQKLNWFIFGGLEGEGLGFSKVEDLHKFETVGTRKTFLEHFFFVLSAEYKLQIGFTCSCTCLANFFVQ